MSNVYGFEGYRKRAARNKKLEELYQAVKELAQLHASEDPAKRYAALGKVFSIKSELDKMILPEPEKPA